MKLSRTLLIASGILTCALFASCATRSGRSNPTADYLAFLKANPGARLSAREEKVAVERFQNFLSTFTEEKIRRDTSAVYAPDAFLDDTLKTVRGSEAIQEYFLGSVANTESITVEFTDMARSGHDYYFRWIMDVEFRFFRRGESVRTVGMTHVRFNEAGQVLLHQDYWDSGRGLFDHVPLIGNGTRFLKSRL